jgi:hypothetical protein
MGHDPIVDEIRAIHEAYAKKFKYDLEANYKDIKEKEKKGGWKMVSLKPRLLQTTPK